VQFMSTHRRRFLQFLSSGAASAAFSGSIARALEIPADRKSGSIEDVEHIVILTQENRSFDQYFGSLRGVRGFGDPRAVTLPTGQPVWSQPNGSATLAPFRPNVPNWGMQFLQDVDHGWTSGHLAWDGGKYDNWIPAKGPASMVYYTRQDIPFHYALADAFTICDAYYCSFIGSTDPNRYHIFTGWLGNDGQGGGPVLDNAELGYDWSSYPEVLQTAGVSWKVYQDIGNGLDAAGSWGWTGNPFIGNYGDNSLLYLHQYQNAAPDSPLYEGARTGTEVLKGGTLFDELRADVAANKLPQVSWIAAPEAYTEHPNWPPNYGAWYISQVLDVLTSNPEVWSKTVLFVNYDENGGFFDHMVSPTPPSSRAEGLSTVDTTSEIFPGSSHYQPGPYGLGVRVPMLVVSPWSKGGWVNSEVFDHTSLIQFIETRFGTRSPNITAWRRAVTGDLTSAFDFRQSNPQTVTLPSTDAYKPADQNGHPNFDLIVPSNSSVPPQETGIRPARPVPYQLNVDGLADQNSGTLTIQFGNTGKSAAVYQVRSGNNSTGPWTYTVSPGTAVSDVWSFNGLGQSNYDLSVYGPNGFLRTFKGNIVAQDVEVATRYVGPGIQFVLRNRGIGRVDVQLRDAYSGHVVTHSLQQAETAIKYAHLDETFGWYDVIVSIQGQATFERRLAGHVETGQDSMTDPALGGFVPGQE
jgi:phospholipase C